MPDLCTCFYSGSRERKKQDPNKQKKIHKYIKKAIVTDLGENREIFFSLPQPRVFQRDFLCY